MFNDNKKIFWKQDCLSFNGYKPCESYKTCNNCDSYRVNDNIILIISLLGLGSVLMSMSILQPLKRKYPNSKIFFLTSTQAIPLLTNNQLVDTVLSFDMKDIITVMNIRFSLLINLDRSKHASSLANMIFAENKIGFSLNDNGTINYYNSEFSYLYDLGLDDELRFKKNKKSMPQILVESLGLKYKNDPYIINLSKTQLDLQKSISLDCNLITSDFKVGINTGCSDLMPYRKIPDDLLNVLIKKLVSNNCKVVLLGGRDEIIKNRNLSKINDGIIDLTNVDLNYGIAAMSLCDIVFSGCSFGLHLAIALKKKCVAWFGPSCSNEVEMFFGGKKFISNFNCSPCWKKECDKIPKCNEKIDVDEIFKAILSFRK